MSLGAPYTDVRVETPDLSLYDLAQIPGLISIDLRPNATGPEVELVFGTEVGRDPVDEGFVVDEVERFTRMNVLASRRRAVTCETVSVGACARCGEDHPDLDFYKLERPVREGQSDEITHWAPCPTNGQPILLRFTPKVFACKR